MKVENSQRYLVLEANIYATKCHLSAFKIKVMISVSHYNSEAQSHRGL